MQLIADTHLHLYGCYDIPRAVAHLVSNLSALATDAEAVGLGFLAERHDGNMFTDILEGRVTTGPVYDARPGADGKSVCVRGPEGAGAAPLFLVPGRQVVTRERLEILALALSGSIPDGLPAETVVERALAQGGVPVLAWAPGKWFFRRGAVVRELIARFAGGCLLIGDTTLRPGLWTEPRLMRLARRRGCRVIAGSDPLPVPGEEAMLGVYVSVLEGPFDPACPLQSAAAVLRAASLAGVRGRRGTLRQVVRRLWQHSRAGH